MSMSVDEKCRLTDIIQGAAELLNREMSPMAIGLYVKTLDDLPFDEVSAAFSKSITESRYFPAPYDIRERVIGAPEKLEDVATVQAARAVDAIKRHGSHKSVVFDDPVTMAVIQQQFGGWERACEMTVEEEKFWRKDFAKAYCAFARTGIRAFGVLYGSHDRINDYSGIASGRTTPVLIGDRQKAMQVWEGEYDRKTLDPPRGRIAKLLAGIGAS